MIPARAFKLFSCHPHQTHACYCGGIVWFDRQQSEWKGAVKSVCGEFTSPPLLFSLAVRLAAPDKDTVACSAEQRRKKRRRKEGQESRRQGQRRRRRQRDHIDIQSRHSQWRRVNSAAVSLMLISVCCQSLFY